MHALHLCFMLLTSAYLPVATKTRIYGGFEGYPTFDHDHSGLMIQCQTDTPYRQDPNLGEDKGGLLAPKKDKNKVCSLLNKAQPNFGSSAAFSYQFCQALRYQNRSKSLVWLYINIDAMILCYR